MNIRKTLSIKGVGTCLPRVSVQSSTIEEQLGLPTDWIDKNIGVHSRYIATDETNTSMGAAALQSALDNANMAIGDIDCLIAAAATMDYIIPNRSALIKNAFIEAHDLDFPCVDINTVCTSFITALDYASMLLSTGEHEHIAIVSSEISSKGINPADPETYSLFGDAAAAIIVSRTDQDAGIVQFQSKTYAQEVKSTIIAGGGNVHHPQSYPYDPALYSFKMEGKKLLRSVKTRLPDFINTFFAKANTTLADTDLIIPHQASKLGLKMLTRLNGGQSSNIVDILAQHGNCISASIPLALAMSIDEGRLKEGDSCFLIGTAAGITISGLLLKYTKL